MPSLTDLIMGQLGDQGIAGLGQKLGSDSAATGKAVGAALPLLLGALAKNAGTPDGAAALDSALARDHDGSLLEGLTSHLQQGPSADGDGILKHVLGGRRSMAEAGISKVSGMNEGQSAQMLSMLAPIVMGALGKAKREGGLDAAGVAGLLSGEKSGAEKALGGLGGLAGLLDRDGDGDIKDDLLGGVAKNLGSKLFGK